MTDDDLRERLQSVDGPVALNEAATQRVLDRMLDAYSSAAADVDDARVFDEPDLVAPTPVDSPDHRGTGWSVWAVRAAAVAVLVATAAIGAALVTDDGDGSVSDTGRADGGSELSSATTSGSAVTTSQPSPVPAAVGPVGYRPFTTYRYVSERAIPGGVETTPLLDRVGEITVDAQGASTLTVRRSMIDATGEDQRTVLDLQVRGGELLAPLEWLDPVAVGGPCSGGVVSITRDAARAIEATADCTGEQRAVEITSVAGPPEDIELSTGSTLFATPLGIDITASGLSDDRHVTLWFTDAGLVRWDFGRDASIGRYDLDADGVAGLDDP